MEGPAVGPLRDLITRYHAYTGASEARANEAEAMMAAATYEVTGWTLTVRIGESRLRLRLDKGGSSVVLRAAVNSYSARSGYKARVVGRHSDAWNAHLGFARRVSLGTAAMILDLDRLAQAPAAT